jgi:hypothetical protein
LSKKLWRPWISYRVEAPLEHCMSIQAKLFCEEILNLIMKSWLSEDFSSKWCIYIYIYEKIFGKIFKTMFWLAWFDIWKEKASH